MEVKPRPKTKLLLRLKPEEELPEIEIEEVIPVSVGDARGAD